MNSSLSQINLAIKDELLSRLSALKKLQFTQLASLPEVATDKVIILEKSVSFTTLVDSKTNQDKIAVAIRSDEKRFGFVDSGITEGFFRTTQNSIEDMSWSDIRDYFE